MAQRFVLKDRSKDADGHKETSHMIRDPKQKMQGNELDIQRDKGPHNKLVRDKKRKGRGRIVSLEKIKTKRRASKLLAPPKSSTK